MNEELRNLCTKLVQYYVGFEEILKPTNDEIDRITCGTLIVNMYKKAKHIKEEHLSFDRNTCVEFMRVLDLSCDRELFMSLSNPDQYNKEYSDKEIEADDDLNEIKNMSVLEIEEKIKTYLFLVAYAKFCSPLARLRPYILSHRKDKDETLAKLLTLFEEVSDNDINTYGKDILTEILNEKICDSFDEEVSEIMVTAINNFLQLTNDDNEETGSWEFLFLSLIILYYKYHKYIFRLSEKEYKILKPYFEGLTAHLRELYSGNKSSILVERLYDIFDEDFTNFLLRDIHNYPELSWVHVDLPAIAVPSEWSVPEDFFSRHTSNDPNEFIGVVFRLYRDPAFIKAVVDEFANMNNIASTPLAKQWTLFLLTGIEKPQSVKPSGSIWKGEVNDLLYVCKYLYKDPNVRNNAIPGLYKKAVELFGAITDKEDIDLSAYTERAKNKNLISLFEKRKKKLGV